MTPMKLSLTNIVHHLHGIIFTLQKEEDNTKEAFMEQIVLSIKLKSKFLGKRINNAKL